VVELRRDAWRSWAAVVGMTIAVAAVGIAVFVLDHRSALAAISQSRYPGDRVLGSGEALPELLCGGPFDLLSARRQFVDVNQTNQSEAASGLMLWLPIAVMGGAIGWWRRGTRIGRALIAVLVASGVLAAWALVPVPTRLGGLLGLTN